MTATKIQVRRDSSTNWTTANPVLSAGELGLDETVMKFKMGDGSTAWNLLSYYGDRTVQPSTPRHGQIWVDTNECPPVTKISSDSTDCPSDSGWVQL